MSQRVKTSARGLVLPRSSSPENGHLRKNHNILISIVGSPIWRHSDTVHYKSDRHDITEILLKVALNTITSLTHSSPVDQLNWQRNPRRRIIIYLESDWPRTMNLEDLLIALIIHSTGRENYLALFWYLIWIVREKTSFTLSLQTNRKFG
jgi:hypothetical protein